MMRNIIVLGITIVVLFGNNQNRLFWDGRDWKRVDTLVDHNPNLSHTVKAAYINGVLDGRLFYYFKIWAKNSEFADSVFAEMTDYLSSNELVRSLNSYYADLLNAYIPVPSAIIIANMHAQQMPNNLIEEYAQESRSWINQLMLDMEKEGYEDLLNQKVEKHEKSIKTKNKYRSIID